MFKKIIGKARKQPIVPPLLIELINTGRWKQPPDETIKKVIPFLQEPMDFLPGIDAMQQESTGFLADSPEMSELFHEYRGSKVPERELPWLDVDKALFIAVNRIAGADIGIVLDYRTGWKTQELWQVIGGAETIHIIGERLRADFQIL